ncbi:MAG TPA: hypothetical protein VMT23_03175 [Candidatus Binatia bacterium]|nr:hypothetical protein [Candidatus Binatia bacterium]
MDYLERDSERRAGNSLFLSAFVGMLFMLGGVLVATTKVTVDGRQRYILPPWLGLSFAAFSAALALVCLVWAGKCLLRARA